MKNEKAYLKKFMYKELDEDDMYVKEEKIKSKKANKEKKKDSKKNQKQLSEDWDTE